MNTLDDITLPDDIWWQDETDWTPVEQNESYSTTGALLLDVSVKQAGRPITLGGDDDIWITRATALALQEKAAQPDLEMALTLYQATYTVRFRHADGKPVDAVPVVRITPPADTDYYILRALRLMAV